MANPAWYNDNQFRDYPFLTRVAPLAETTGINSSASLLTALDLPHSAILDFGAVMEIDAGFDESLGHYVYLHSISRSGSLFTFKLRTNAPDAANHELIFHRNLTAAEFEIEWEDASTIVAEEDDPLVCQFLPKWSGFMVTGNLADLAAIVDDGDELVAVQGLWQIEPARIQSLLKSYLRAVNLANKPRVHATPPDACSLSSSAASEIAIVNALCLAGPLQWKEGYNCTIRQDTNSNAIIIGAGVAAGAGEPCEEIPIYPGEQPPADSRFLSGGPACNEVIKSINGVSGKDINLVSGAGFRIFADGTDPNKLVIDRTLDDFVNPCVGSVFSSLSTSAVLSPCDDITIDDTFDITVTSGVLRGKTAHCVYDPVMSAEGERSWVSPFVTDQNWVNGAFCSYRWRAKVTCNTDGLRVYVIGYPLADNTPCITCSQFIPHPVDMPWAASLTLSSSRPTHGCDCVSTNLARRVTIAQ